MINQIYSSDLKQKLDQKEKILLIDCREQNEWDAGHIQEAVLMPLGQFEELFKTLDKNAQIIVQCRSGQRSMRACVFLEEKGFKNLTNLEGGIIGWAQSGYPIVESDGE